MSPLWSGKQETKRKLLANLAKPSPAYQSNRRDSARNPANIQKGGMVRPHVASCSIEGISPLASCCEQGIGLEPSLVMGELGGGMTVEAAILLPLLLFFFLSLGCAIEMIRLHGNIQLALWQAGRELSVYGYVLNGGEEPDADRSQDGWWGDLGETAFASAFVKSRLTKLAGKEYLDNSPLTKGADGLTLWESDLLGPGDTIDIVVTYSVSPWSGLLRLPSFRMANRYYSHIWNGYALQDGEEKAEEVQMVYVTEHSSVYHLYEDCTHLRISIREVLAGGIEAERNQKGGRYRPCEKCRSAKGNGVLLYVTDDGDCYHSDRNCSGLKRRVYRIERKEAAGLGLCVRCGQRVP